VGGALYNQEGWLGAARDPWAASIEQDLGLMDLAHKNMLKTEIYNVLKEIEDPLFQEGGEHFDKNLGRQSPNMGKNERAQTLVRLVDGKPHSFWVSNTVAQFVQNATPMEARVWRNVVRVTLRDLKLLFTAWNYGFRIFNYPRDKEAWVKRLPGFKMRRLGRYRYSKYVPEARAAANSILNKEPNALAMEALKARVLSVFPQGLRPGESGLWDFIMGQTPTAKERLVKAYDLRPGQMGEAQSKTKTFLDRVAAWYLKPMRRTELETKLAAWLYLNERYPDYPASEKQRNVLMMGGSPYFADKMSGNYWIDAMAPFANAATRGAESEWRAFTDDPGGFTIKWTQQALLPKLLMFGLAAGWFKKILGDRLSDEYAKMMEAIGTYYKMNYTVIPLWWDPTDKTKSKVVFITRPKDEGNRGAGALMWALMNKANPTEILDFGADQLPGLNPIIKTGYAWTQFLTGNQMDLKRLFQLEVKYKIM
jgi:hypothetical protein